MEQLPGFVSHERCQELMGRLHRVEGCSARKLFKSWGRYFEVRENIAPMLKEEAEAIEAYLSEMTFEKKKVGRGFEGVRIWKVS
jgi:hypothetical protein